MPEHEPGPRESLAALHALVPAAEAEDCFEQAETARLDALQNAWRRELERMEAIKGGPPAPGDDQLQDDQLQDDQLHEGQVHGGQVQDPALHGGDEPQPRLTLGQVRGLLEYYLGARRLDGPGH